MRFCFIRIILQFLHVFIEISCGKLEVIGYFNGYFIHFTIGFNYFYKELHQVKVHMSCNFLFVCLNISPRSHFEQGTLVGLSVCLSAHMNAFSHRRRQCSWMAFPVASWPCSYECYICVNISFREPLV